MTAGSQTTVLYDYDAAGRLTTLTQGTSVVTLNYDAADERTSATLPNGIAAAYSYDDVSRLTAITYALGGATIGDVTYQYDAAGRRTALGGTWARTNLPTAMISATYDQANQTATFRGVSVAHDLNGNVTSDGVSSFTWNARNQLISLSGPTSASFQYDGVGRRRSKTVGGTTTKFLYDGINLVQELVGTTPTADLLTGADVDEVFVRTDSAGARTILADALGSSLALTDASGSVQTEYVFEPFGATTTSGTASTNSVQFIGRENDGTGLYFNRARFYNPSLQRWMSEDPLGVAGGFNLYAYVDNDPTNLTDRLGLAPDTWFECWAKCIERRRWDWGSIPLLSALPKRFLPPFRVPNPNQPLTTLPSVLAHYLQGVMPDFATAMRTGGRMASRIATPLTIVEGGYDWYVIIDCAIKCRKDVCR
jgi:RHS repeat-associated protein